MWAVGDTMCMGPRAHKTPTAVSRVALQENVDMMSQYIGLDKFKHIYVVDLCHSLCEVARKKARTKGWKNVTVIEGDACRFQPPEGMATLVTFSYSLSSECSSRERWRAPQQGSHRRAEPDWSHAQLQAACTCRLAAAICLLQYHPLLQ